MRALCVGLLLVAVAPAEDVVVDLVPGWAKGEVCELVIRRTIRVRGQRKVGNVDRALTVERDDEADYRDRVVSTTAAGAPASLERKFTRARETTTTSLAGLKSETKTEKDPAEGSTQTVEAGRKDAFLIEALEHAIYRRSVKVGETWEGPTAATGDVKDGKLTFKLVEVLTFKGERAARVFVMLKAKIASGAGKADVEARGYVYFSLDKGRIIRSNLRGPVKLQLQGAGTVHGTLAEEATLTLVEPAGAAK